MQRFSSPKRNFPVNSTVFCSAPVTPASSNFYVVWKECLGTRSLGKLKFAWVVPEGSPVIGKPCEAASKGDQVGEDITVQCTGAVKAGDLLLKKTGDYLLELPPALHCFSLRFVCCTFFCMLYARKYFVMDVSSYHDVHLPLFPIEAV